MTTGTPPDESPPKPLVAGSFGVRTMGWMSTAKLRSLFEAGLTYDEIAEANGRDTGWRPSRAAVMHKRAELGFPPRRGSNKELLPWAIRPEHRDHPWRRLLAAETKVQKGGAGDRDLAAHAQLHELLFGRGALMVIDYLPETKDGFHLVLREDGDEAFIRPPTHVSALRMDIQAALRNAETDDELVIIAVRDGVRPEALENFGRNAAADRLRSIRAAAGREAPAAPVADLGHVRRRGTPEGQSAPGRPQRRARRA